MSRQKLIKKLKNKYPNLNKIELETVLNIFTENIAGALKKGNTVEIRGLGRWYCKKLKDVNEEQVSKGPTNVTNALFVGSTADLAKLIKNETPKKG